ncbi:MAG TPA: LysR family transcriptional regulator [Candidatus Scybalocola faecipullorum]|nr:LysR family transcriptional regulator [Candidatus Scybalocola faecipullorum]
MIEIYLLEQLDAFARHGTLSAAAQALHTSQPSMTRAMQKLEDELGVALFIRSKNHLALNETGRRAAQYARHVLTADQDFEDKVKAYDRSLHTLSIGFCAPVPQIVLTPIINSIFEGMTLSMDMMEDSCFTQRLKDRTYQLAVLHQEPDNDLFYSKKCGHEDLYISVQPGNPLAFYPEVHLKDLDGLSILLLSRIGFWANMHRAKTPNTHYLLQVDQSSFSELAQNSSYPVFSSSYYIRRGDTVSGRINIPIVDSECHTDFYLTCLRSDKEKYAGLFRLINDETIL